MQSRDREQMKRPGLLKRLLNVFRRLMTEAKNDPAQKILHLRRIIESATNNALHPGARFLRRAQNRIPGIFSQERAVFGVANKQTSPHILAREVRAHV